MFHLDTGNAGCNVVVQLGQRQQAAVGSDYFADVAEAYACKLEHDALSRNVLLFQQHFA